MRRVDVMIFNAIASTDKCTVERERDLVQVIDRLETISPTVFFAATAPSPLHCIFFSTIKDLHKLLISLLPTSVKATNSLLFLNLFKMLFVAVLILKQCARRNRLERRSETAGARLGFVCSCRTLAMRVDQEHSNRYIIKT